MRALLQRVSRSSVTVESEVTGSIDQGLLVLAAVRHGDSPEHASWLARKIAGLRIFPDDTGKMNRSVVEAGGRILLVSQFTLYGDARKGRRPSFTDSAPPDVAVPLLDDLKRRLEEEGVSVETGRFGAHMEVDLLNDGPVTMMLDTDDMPGAPAPKLSSGRFRLVGEGSPLENVRLVLASASPRRRTLLRDLGLSFTVEAPDVDERNDLPTDPEEHALAIADRKVRVFAERYRESIILAADTVVVVDNLILGKPGDPAEAAGMLRLLRGKEHRVITGLSVAHPGRDLFRQRAVSTTVRFYDLDDAAIDRYVATGEPMGKAGAYAIQGLGGLLVAGIEGDYTNVVGLPLGATLDLLQEVLGVAPAAR